MPMPLTQDLKVAVCLPCYNEALTVGSVVADFKKHLPQAQIYVFDNNSGDETSSIAQKAGAIVVPSRLQGKGNVVRHMFDLIDADYYIMADGDMTYPAEMAPQLLAMAQQTQCDMLVGQRLNQHEGKSFRKFHKFGNHLISKTIKFFFQTEVTDVLSGYRVMSRHFVKSVPLISKGFEIETELTLQSAIKRFSVLETPIFYMDRPEGSFSKLNTFSDGFRILKTILFVLRYYRPMFFFGAASALTGILSVAFGMPAILDFVREQYVYHVPSAILAAALGTISFLMLSIGIVLETVHRYHQENFILWKKILNHR